MPLTDKGKKIMSAMKKQYGKNAERVFYAAKNKGTIKGVDVMKAFKGAQADTKKEHITSSQKGMGKVVKWLMFYLEYFYSDRNRVEKFRRELILLLSYLKEHKVDVIIFNSLGLPKDDKDSAKYSKKITDYLKENTNFLSFKYNYYGKPYDNETIDSWNAYLSRNRGVRDWIAPDGHPGKESHKWLSTYIYDYIKRGFRNA